MRNMKDLIILTLFYCLFYFVFISNNNFAFIFLNFIILYFWLMYINQRYRNKALILKYKDNLDKILHSQKKYFSMVLTHDLKIPTIAQLRGLQSLRAISPNLSREQKEIISQTEYSCKYILDMISMIISTYEFETKKQKLVYETFNMSDLLIKCFEEMSERAIEKNLTFTYSKSTNDTNVEADKAEIEKVIKNLLNNAINHSFSGSNIDVSICANKHCIKLTISGMQLSFDKVNNIFQKSNNIIPQYTTIGQNIGMYLSKKIIEFHNGKIYSSYDTKVNNKLIFEIPRYSSNRAVKAALL